MACSICRQDGHNCRTCPEGLTEEEIEEVEEYLDMEEGAEYESTVSSKNDFISWLESVSLNYMANRLFDWALSTIIELFRL